MTFKKQIKLTIILVLFIFGVIVSLLTYSERFSILVFPGNRNNVLAFKNEELLKGEKIKGEFKARENNLGIVAVRFNTFKRINSDSVFFRIQQKNTNAWYYENKYKVDQFQPDDFFTFGFPVINDSKEKTYRFEIESVSGKINDAISLSNGNPVFLTKYQFSNTKYSPIFIFKKILNSFSNSEFVSHAILYFLPLAFYIFFLLLNLKVIYKRYVLLILNFLIIFLDILDLINFHNNGALVFLILGFLVIQFRYYAIKSRVLFLIVFLLFSFLPIILFSGNVIIAERLTTWVVLLLTTALVVEISSKRNFYKNKVLK